MYCHRILSLNADKAPGRHRIRTTVVQGMGGGYFRVVRVQHTHFPEGMLPLGAGTHAPPSWVVTSGGTDRHCPAGLWNLPFYLWAHSCLFWLGFFSQLASTFRGLTFSQILPAIGCSPIRPLLSL